MTPIRRPYRLLVTGSRDWDDVPTIWQAMGAAARDAGPGRDLVIVHGAGRAGADWHADRWARHAAAQIERHPADWQRHGRAAGPIRNREMVQLGADLCLAFIRNGSRGSSHCAQLAERAGIPVRRWTA